MKKIPETDLSRKIYYHLLIPFYGKFPVISLFKLFNKFDKWRKEHSGTYPVTLTREEMYSSVFDKFSNKKINVLEFGVFKGESLQKFLQLNSHEDSRFYGFDTFTGLPDDWNDLTRKLPRGTFNTDGKFPDITDPRVSFVRGKFEETLPGFLKNYQPVSNLVIHIDSDLYNSAKFVLDNCSHLFTGNCVIIFDEFYSLAHEFIALYEFCESTGRKYRVICGTKNYVQIAIIFNTEN